MGGSNPVQYNRYLRKILKTIRDDLRYDNATLWTTSEIGVSDDDVFAVPTSITSGSRIFSGAIAWGPTIRYQDEAGGAVKHSDCTIIASSSEKSFIDAENIYLVADGIRLRPLRIIEATDTEEIVIHCERMKT